jgi:hypothetical protein
MTAIRRGEDAPLQTDGSPPGHTLAMTLVSGGCVAMVAVTVFFMVAVVLPAADDPRAAAIIPIVGGFVAASAVIGAASVFWTGARHRAWFWLVTVVPALLLLLLNARQIPYDITRPASTSGFLMTIVVLTAATAVIVGGIAAFLDVRRGRATLTRTGRAGWVITALIGVVIGAAATSLVAGSASAGGGLVPEAPTTTGVVTAKYTKFVETSLIMKNGAVLGLFINNRDAVDHAFDVDSLGIHVQLPAHSTTAVAIKPGGPGRLQFYCGVPGHREAGMVGTINVE